MVGACLKSSVLWPKVRTLRLSTNMRAHVRGDGASASFAQALLTLGDGTMPNDDRGFVLLDSLCSVVATASDLMDSVFPQLPLKYSDMEWLSQRAILAPKNSIVNNVNDQLLQLIPGEAYVYKSIDRTIDPEDAANSY